MSSLELTRGTKSKAGPTEAGAGAGDKKGKHYRPPYFLIKLIPYFINFTKRC